MSKDEQDTSSESLLEPLDQVGHLIEKGKIEYIYSLELVI